MRLADLTPEERQNFLDIFKTNARMNMELSWEEFCAMWTVADQDEKKDIYEMMKAALPRFRAPE